MSFDCGVGECKSGYSTIQSLRQHQRKKHATEYAQNSLMIRKKQRVDEPLPEHLAPKAKFVNNGPIGPIGPELALAHETCQVAMANTHQHMEELVEQLRTNTNEHISQLTSNQSGLLAQITDLHQRMKLLAKQTAKWCIVCYERENEYAFLPCGHKCMCGPCANTTAAKSLKCPICRQNIGKIQRIYDINAFV